MLGRGDRHDAGGDAGGVAAPRWRRADRAGCRSCRRRWFGPGSERCRSAPALLEPPRCRRLTLARAICWTRWCGHDPTTIGDRRRTIAMPRRGPRRRGGGGERLLGLRTCRLSGPARHTAQRVERALQVQGARPQVLERGDLHLVVRDALLDAVDRQAPGRDQSVDRLLQVDPGTGQRTRPCRCRRSPGCRS